jgi:sec-independent protein translocase protein TatC
MALLDHLEELRRRVLVSLAAYLVAAVAVYARLADPLIEVLTAPLGDRRLVFLGLAEAFWVRLKVSLWGGLILAFPVVAWQVWRFVAPGLYRRERRAVAAGVLASTVLFTAGAFLGYAALLPAAVRFFLAFEAPNLAYQAQIGPYLSLAAGLVLAAGLAFQVPIVVYALGRAGILTRAFVRQWRPAIVVGIFALAAILTPSGDAFTQCLLAVPTWILFEISVLLARLR